MSNELFQSVLNDYNERAAREAETWRKRPAGDIRAARDEALLPVVEEVGWFLRTLAIARGAKRILEIGTSYGYSTLFLADAARITGGRVITLELAENKQIYARGQLEKAKLARCVD